MARNIDYQKPEKNNKSHKKALIRRRQKLLKAAVLTLTILIVIVFCFIYKNSSINSLEDASKDIDTSASNSVQPTNSITTSQTKATAVDTVNLKDAAKPLKIKVSITSQTVTVLDAKNRIVENFICSTGEAGSDTPTGTFTVKEKGESFFSQTYQEGAYYWTQFDGDFLFHSVPFDKSKNIEAVEAAKLGTKASHGCVRLSIDNAKWIYDNIPRGTVVVIE